MITMIRATAVTAAVTPAIAVTRVAKTYGSGPTAVRALVDVSLDVLGGEVLLMMGPSGSGKTTLLSIMGGILDASSGSVRVRGEELVGMPERERPRIRRTHIGFVFQGFNLFPALTALENVALPLDVRGERGPDARDRARVALERVGLGDKIDAHPADLSGGQKQRVAIARALVNDPEVLLLDEPLGALDLQLRLQMHDELKRIHKEIRSTFILVTHDQGEAITLSDRIGVMESGHIVQLGTPHDIYSRPRSRFVAQFIGHANFIDGTVSPRSGLSCTLSSNGLAFNGYCEEPHSTQASATGVLRYEKVRILPADTSEGFPATVEDVTFLGSTYRITMKLENGMKIIAERGDDGGAMQLRPGAKIRASWADESLVVLPG